MNDARRLQEIATEVATARRAALKLSTPKFGRRGRIDRRLALLDLNTALEIAMRKLSAEITMAFEEADMMSQIEAEMRRPDCL